MQERWFCVSKFYFWEIGERAQTLKELDARLEDLNSVPGPTPGGSQPSVSAALGDSVPLAHSGPFPHMYIHTCNHIVKGNENEFLKLSFWKW